MNSSRNGSLLLIDDDRYIREAISEYLRDLGYRTETAASFAEAVERMKEFPFDAVICDVNLGDSDGFQLLEWARGAVPETEIIMLTGYGTIESAVEAIRMGAFEYLTKPVIDEELQLAVERALAQRQIIAENKTLKAQLDRKYGRENIIGNDYKMAKLFDLVESVADTRATVLILGESGTGKTMTARAIHHLSSRHDKPFIEVPCGALAETLLESELFGHVAGAFTGASQDKHGKFLQANGGTLFLDEIATASPALQIKLLRVLQDREFEPVGGAQTHKVDVRLVLATNEDLDQLVREGRFRQDLYYRINVITLRQPPLRERTGDVPLLVEHYLSMFNEQNGKHIDRFDNDSIDLMQRYDWPGNVRELVNVVERAVVLCRGNIVTPAELPEGLRDGRIYRSGLGDGEELSANSLKEALADPERHLIIEALEANGWNRQKTAKLLGINRTTLYKKMKKYDIRYEHEHSYS